MIGYRVLVTPPGSGSTHIIAQLNSHARPDVIFDPFSNHTLGGELDNCGLKITDKPIKDHQAHFLKRTLGDFKLELDLTIEQNIVNYIDLMNNRTKGMGNLCGAISTISRQFFSRNRPKRILAIIRHPLHSMVSWLSHQHPFHGWKFGGINTEGCVEFYADRWNRLTSDLIAGKIKIIRFEYMAEDSADIKDLELKALFKTWMPNLRNHNKLLPQWESLLKCLTERNYSKLYEKWEI